MCVCTLTKFPSPLTWVLSLANLSYVVRKPSYIWSTIVVSLFVFWFASFFPFFFCFLIFFSPYDLFFPSSLLVSFLYYRQTVLFFFSPPLLLSCPRHCVTNKSYIKIKNIQCDDVFFLPFSNVFSFFSGFVVLGASNIGQPHWPWLSWRLFQRYKVIPYTGPSYWYHSRELALSAELWDPTPRRGELES